MYKIPQEVLDDLIQYEWFEEANIVVDQSDGLWICYGDIDFSEDEDFVEFPEWFRNFKEIRGSLNCSGTHIKSFKGLENLQNISEFLHVRYCDNLKTFDGINPFVKINEINGLKTYAILPRDRNSEFLQWREQARKSKQVQDIANALLDI